MRILSMMLIAATLAGCASGPPSVAQQRRIDSEAARLDKALAGKTAGKPVSCINLRDAHGPESFGDGTLVFYASRKLVYRNDTRGTCRDIGKHRALITRPFGSQLCRGDIAQSADLSAGFVAESCVLGDFVPYRGS